MEMTKQLKKRMKLLYKQRWTNS